MGRIDYETETLVASTLKANNGGGGFGSDPNETFIPVTTHSLRADGFDASEDGTGRGTPLVPVQAFYSTESRHDPIPPDISPPLKVGSNGGGQPPAIAFSCKDHGADAGDIAPTLRSMGHDESHANAGGQVAVAFNLRGREDGAQPEVSDVASLRAASGGSSRSYVAQAAVRRLLPVECARLQGFSDDYFDGVLLRGKPLADGPIYKMLGNSMCTHVVRWIGERIKAVDAVKPG